jgi:Fucose permease
MHGISDSEASTFMIYSYVAWFVGKLVANWFMNRYSITKVLTWFSALGMVCLVIAFTVPNATAVYAAIATSFFFGPEWPTIYAHTLDQIHEKKYTETGGAFIVMSLIGGAIVPAIQGRVSDLSGPCSSPSSCQPSALRSSRSTSGMNIATKGTP